jgi:hypothetical protein
MTHAQDILALADDLEKTSGTPDGDFDDGMVTARNEAAGFLRALAEKWKEEPRGELHDWWPCSSCGQKMRPDLGYYGETLGMTCPAGTRMKNDSADVSEDADMWETRRWFGPMRCTKCGAKSPVGFGSSLVVYGDTPFHWTEINNKCGPVVEEDA